MGTADRSSVIATRSELPEVVLHLEGDVFLAERVPLRALHGEERAREHRTERVDEHGVGRQLIERLRETRWQAPDSPRVTLGVRPITRIDQRGLSRRELAADAVEPGCEQAAERQVGIRR